MKLALKADRLIDGTGADAVSNGAIVIENGKITEITTQQALQFAPGEDVEVIEVSGGSIMPGFIEMHSHMHCNAQEDAYAHIMTESDEVFLMRAVGAARSGALVGCYYHAKIWARATRWHSPSSRRSKTASFRAHASSWQALPLRPQAATATCSAPRRTQRTMC